MKTTAKISASSRMVGTGQEQRNRHFDPALKMFKIKTPSQITLLDSLPPNHSRTMLSCARVVASRAFSRPSIASRSLATVSPGNANTSGIPIVDFANFGSLSFDQRRETARQVVDGFRNTGFVYLANHGISDGVVQEAFKRVRGPVTRKIRCSTEYV